MIRPRIEFDRNTKLKFLKIGHNGRIKNENEELAITVRSSAMFSACGHDMSLFIMVMQRMFDEFSITDKFIDDAYAAAVEEASNYPYAGELRKVEDIRLEVFGNPSIVLENLIARDHLERFAGSSDRLSVYYGKGVIADYKPHLRKSETIAVSAAAAVLVDGQVPNAEPTQKVEDQAAVPFSSTDPEARRTVAYRIDRMLGKDALDEKLIELLEAKGPLAGKDVVEHLMKDSGRLRLRDGTVKGIDDALAKLIARTTLCFDEAGRYRLTRTDPPPPRDGLKEPHGIGAMSGSDAANDPITDDEGTVGSLSEDGHGDPGSVRSEDDRGQLDLPPAGPSGTGRIERHNEDDDLALAALTRLGDQVIRRGTTPASALPHRP